MPCELLSSGGGGGGGGAADLENLYLQLSRYSKVVLANEKQPQRKETSKSTIYCSLISLSLLSQYFVSENMA